MMMNDGGGGAWRGGGGANAKTGGDPQGDERVVSGSRAYLGLLHWLSHHSAGESNTRLGLNTHFAGISIVSIVIPEHRYRFARELEGRSPS